MEQVEYRYAVCIVIEPDGVRYHTRRIIVRRWETNVIPRIIKDKGKLNLSRIPAVTRLWYLLAFIFNF